MFLKKTKKRNNGSMMVEVIIASSIIAASVLAFLTVAQRSIVLSRQAIHFSQASFLLEEGAEAVRIYRDNGWANIPALSTASTYYPALVGNAWTFSTTPNKVGIFTRTITLSLVNRDAGTGRIGTTGANDIGTRLITVNVSWPESGRTITKSLPFYLSNIFP